MLGVVLGVPAFEGGGLRVFGALVPIEKAEAICAAGDGEPGHAAEFGASGDFPGVLREDGPDGFFPETARMEDCVASTTARRETFGTG